MALPSLRPCPESIVRRIQSGASDADFCAALLHKLEDALGGRQLRFMEVCGTHTTALFQSGLRQLLPKNIVHLSGPGCPVCVTADAEIALLLKAAAMPGVILATFGDLMRVPGPDGFSLKHAQAEGARVEIVYSPLEALQLACANPDKEVIFVGVGFETTAPTTAAAILSSGKTQNFSVFSFHKLVPPVLAALLRDQGASINAFLLPGHVATITGIAPFAFIGEEFAIPSAISGFEPADLLLALIEIARQYQKKNPVCINAYPRAVAQDGNPRARELLFKIFQTASAPWRGMGVLPDSGLALRHEYERFDAMKKFSLTLPETRPIPGCRCGDILKGLATPPECPLFGKKCTPASPVGPCMVSTEGSCAAWHKYGEY